jgi:hypothetical protein
MDWLVHYWTSSLLNKIVFIFGTLTFIAAVIGIVYAIYLERRPPSDDDYMKDDNGKLLYWDLERLPLNIQFSNKVDSRILKLLKECVNEINSKTNKQLLNPEILIYEEAGTERVDIFFDEFTEELSEALTKKCGSEVHGGSRPLSHFKTGEIGYMTVVIKEDMDDSETKLTLYHELGHVLCLDHDRRKSSMMYYNSTSRRALGFSKKDIEKLNNIYK